MELGLLRDAFHLMSWLFLARSNCGNHQVLPVIRKIVTTEQRGFLPGIEGLNKSRQRNREDMENGVTVLSDYIDCVLSLLAQCNRTSV